MNVSIIIPTKNREVDLLECVDSINKQTVLPDEVVIIDQSDTAKTKALVEQNIHKDIRLTYIYDSSIKGGAKARNIGIERSRGDVLFFIDDDNILFESTLANLKKVFEEDPNKQIGGAGALVLDYDGNIFWELGLFIFYHGPFRGMYQKTYFYRNYKKIRQKLFPADMISSFVAYRRDVVDEFKFDNTYEGISYGEDLLFSYLISRKYSTYFSTEIPILHKKSPSNRMSRAKMAGMNVFFYFYFYQRYLKKSFFNTICYLFLNVSFLMRMVKNICFLEFYVARYYIDSYKAIAKVLCKRSNIDTEVIRILS